MGNKLSFKNAFMQEYLNMPNSRAMTIVFPWNITNKYFEIHKSQYNIKKAEGRIEMREIEDVINRMEKEVKNFKISHTPLYKILINTGIFGFLCSSTYVYLKKYGIYILTFGILSSFLSGVFINRKWRKDILKRGEQISRIINEVNEDYRGRMIQWNCGKYGTYFRVWFFKGDIPRKKGLNTLEFEMES